MFDRREIIRTAGYVWPAAVSAILFTLMEVVDTAMLGTLGVGPMAAGALASTIVYLVLVFPMQGMRALVPLAAWAGVTGGRVELLRLRRVSMVASLGVGLAGALLILGAAWLLPSLGYESAVAEPARSYLLWRAPSLPIEVAFYALWATLEGLCGTRAPLRAGLACVAVNVLLNLALIPGRWGFPALGVTGAAIATDLAMAIGLATLVAAVRRQERAATRWRPAVRPGETARAMIDGQLLRRLVRIGWPLGVAGLMDVLGWLVIGLMIARMGAVATATHAVMNQLIALGLAVAQGSAVAATILVARATGRSDRLAVLRGARQALTLQMVISLVLVALIWSHGGDWIKLFTGDAQVNLAGAQLTSLALAIVWMEGVVLVLCGVVEGTGRTGVLLIATLMFDLAFALIAVCAIRPHDGLGQFYAAWLLKNALKAAFLVTWFRRHEAVRLILASCFTPQLWVPRPRPDFMLARAPVAALPGGGRARREYRCWMLPAPDN